MKKTVKQIDKEIREKKKQLKKIKGIDCEIYTRIVGYYRPVKQWNYGQVEQRKNRKNFKLKGERHHDSKDSN